MSDARAALSLTRYRDVRDALNDTRLVIHKPLAVGTEEAHVGARVDRRRSHRIAPLRTVLAQQLGARQVEQMAGFVADAVDRIVGAAEARGGMEVVAELAFPLPVAVMGALLGVDVEGSAPLRPLFEAITRGHDQDATEQDRQHARFAQLSITRWLAPRLRASRSPVLDAIRTVAERDRIEAELVDYWCMMLLYAGSATTRDLIANAIALLVEHREAGRLLASGSVAVPLAIDEILRFDGPVRGIGRVATADLEIGGHRIAQGDLVYLLLADANRDPDWFPDAERLDLTRSPNPHLAFGTGATYCLGSHLARLEAGIVLERMRALLPHAAAHDLADWSPVRLLRQRNTLRLTLGTMHGPGAGD